MRPRHVRITVFVLVWTLLFFYQTFRVNHLSPLARRAFGLELPRVPLLFPPAGWIMFYHIDPSYGFAEVYGMRGGQPARLDPHDIFETRAIGYDNIHRNVLIGILYAERAPHACRYLERKFPMYDGFAVVYGQYPDLLNDPERIVRQVAYRCP